MSTSNGHHARWTITDLLVGSIPIFAILIFLVGAVLVGRVFCIVSQLQSQNLPTTATPEDKIFRATFNLAEKQLAVRSLQLAAGYGVGFLCVSSGVILAWCGVSGQVEFKAAAGTNNVSLQTGSVGAFIVLCGVILLAISMFSRPIKVESAGGIKFENSFGDASSNQVEF